MIEVMKNLYVGSEIDYENVKDDGWVYVHACKEPFHRNMVGYVSRGAPKDSPHYLFIEKDNRLALNIVDADSPDFFDKSMIDKAIQFISDKVKGNKVLVHCNQGMSRSASIAMLYTALSGNISNNFDEAEKEFIKLYPMYSPKQGIRGHIINNWNEYMEGKV